MVKSLLSEAEIMVSVSSSLSSSSKSGVPELCLDVLLIWSWLSLDGSLLLLLALSLSLLDWLLVSGEDRVTYIL